MMLSLYAMDIPNSEGKWYVGFIEQTKDNDICVNMEEIIKIIFDTVERVEIEN